MATIGLDKLYCATITENPATYHVLCQDIEITLDGHTPVVFKDETRINVED